MTVSRTWALAAALFANCGAAMAQAYVLPIEFWDRPRTARAVLEQPAIRDAVNAHLAENGSRIVLHHGPTQEARLLAEELRAWLIALALEPSQLTLQNDLKLSDPLRIEVIRK